MYKKLWILSFTLLSFLMNYSQTGVGINTVNPQGTFHVDGLGNNTGATPIPPLQSDDVTITSNGSIGIGTTQPVVSAALDIRTPNKAIRVPNVSLSGLGDITTIPNPQAGMIVFNTTTNKFCYFNGSQWAELVTAIPNVVTPRIMLQAQSNTSNSTYTSGSLYYDTRTYDPENSCHLGVSTSDPTSYTVKKAGLHQVFVNFTNQAVVPASAWKINILKNGTVIGGMDTTTTPGAGASASVFAISNFAVGDVITVMKSGGNSGWAAKLSCISIFRLE